MFSVFTPAGMYRREGLFANDPIEVPDNLSSELSGQKEIRVIVLYEEKEDQDEKDFQNLAREQFLAGYSKSDSIYDDE
jgi:hypothetical protein